LRPLNGLIFFGKRDLVFGINLPDEGDLENAPGPVIALAPVT
jgi:hypothetical protein